MAVVLNCSRAKVIVEVKITFRWRIGTGQASNPALVSPVVGSFHRASDAAPDGRYCVADADSNCQVPAGSTSTPPYMLPAIGKNDAKHPYSVTMGYCNYILLFPYGNADSAGDLGI